MNKQDKVVAIIPFIVTLVGALTLIIAFFLPYASATGEYRELLNTFSSGTYSSSLGMTNGDAINISMFDFAKIYSSDEIGVGGVLYVVIIAAIGVLSILCLIAAFVKKPIFLMVSTVLTFAVFCLLSWDFTDRGIINSTRYVWGISYYIYYIGIFVLIAGAIWTLIVRKKSSMPYSASGEQ